jgi:mycothiol synthase
MTITLPAPRRLPGHTWRALRPEDAGELHRLELDCGSTDQTTKVGSFAVYRGKLEEAGARAATDTLSAVSPGGHFAAAAWVTCDEGVNHEFRFFLHSKVHPRYRKRGLGSFLLQWMEARARQILATLGDDRPCALRVDLYDGSDDAIPLLERHGFRYALAEDEMCRDLNQPIPWSSLPDGMSFVTWNAERASLFYLVYDHAFRGRPGFPGWTEDVWRHDLTAESTFRGDLSLLLMDGPEPVGFAICHIENEGDGGPSSEGWIAQMGVRPPWRKRGLGTALLCEVMQRLKTMGSRYAVLEVNTNNPEARSLYRGLGFEYCRRRSSFQKSVSRAEQC